MAQQRGGQLGIEHRRRHGLPAMEEQLQILVGRVQHLFDVRIQQQLAQRCQIAHAQRIDAGDGARRAELDQAQLREIGALAHELRVQREVGRGAQRLAQLGQGAVVIDVDRIHSGRFLGGRVRGGGLL